MDSDGYSKINDSPMDLQCLAAKSVGIWLIHEWADGEIPEIDVWKNANKYDTCSDHDWFLWQLYEMEVPRFAYITLPNKIRNQIDDNLAPLLDEVVIWIQFHHNRNFFHEPQQSSLNEYVVKLVWNHDFKIDYAATAKNILTNEKLNPLERFRFASTYCIVEEMEKFRELMADPDSLPEWDFSEDPFVVYWSKTLGNELDTCSLPGVTDEFPLNTLMFIKTLEKFDSWPAVVYFFQKLDSESKSSKFECIVERYGKRYLKDLLAKLTDREWKLASRSAVLKMVEKVVEYGFLDDVRLIWQLFGSEMDSKDFCSILETLVPLSMKNASNFEKWTPLLMEIWSSASGELKQSAIDIKLWPRIGRKFILRISLEYSKEFHALRQISDPMKFIRLALISMESDAKKRKEFFIQNFHWLIIWAPFDEVEKLMQDFLERFDHDVVELKNEIAIANSSNADRLLLIFILFVDFDEMDELDAALPFYLRNYRGILKDLNDDEINYHGYWLTLIQNLLEHKKDSNVFYGPIFFCVYFAIWKILFLYAKITISVARIAPNSFVNALIELAWFREICYSRTEPIATQIRGFLLEMQHYLSKMLEYSNEPDFEFLKKKFKVYLFTSLFDTKCPVERVFNRVNVQNFLLWIYDGDEKLIDENFKQSGQVVDGFLVQFKFCVNEESFQATKSMEEFLEWCFETEAERREFKRGMIYKFREYKLIEDLLTSRKYRRAMLFWFFNGDFSAVETFAVEYSRNPILTVNAAEADSDAASSSDPEADDDGDE